MIELKTPLYLQPIGELAEWSNAAVLKTVEGHTSGGSNPSFSAKEIRNESFGFFCLFRILLKGASFFLKYEVCIKNFRLLYLLELL